MEPITEPPTILKRKSPANQRLTGLNCGERGIRTPGGVTLNGFQDRRNRPLCHLSECRCLFDERKVTLIFLFVQIFWQLFYKYFSRINIKY